MIRQKNIKQHIVLVVVAHADDETLGVGGTISKHVSNGDIVYGISMTNDVSARGNKNKKEIKKRMQASINAGKILGLNWIESENFTDDD